jgi:hypothetical protein
MAGFERTSGLRVAAYYGPRKSGGQEGVHLTDGMYNEYMIDLSAPRLGFLFPRGDGRYVIGVDTTWANGTVTAVTIGGVAVLAATDAAPVQLTNSNTGVVAVTGTAAGRIIIRYKNIEGDRDLTPPANSDYNKYDPVVSVSATPSSLSIVNGNSKQITASVLPATANQAVTYSTSDATKATVSASGLVTGVAAGSATITVTAVGDITKTATVSVTVT